MNEFLASNVRLFDASEKRVKVVNIMCVRNIKRTNKKYEEK